MTLSIITSPIRVQQARGLGFAAGRLDRSELRAGHEGEQKEEEALSSPLIGAGASNG